LIQGIGTQSKVVRNIRLYIYSSRRAGNKHASKSAGNRKLHRLDLLSVGPAGNHWMMVVEVEGSRREVSVRAEGS
jgi:hypothetical protein